MPKVFISYAHSSAEHKALVAKLAEDLKKAKLEVSIDTDVKKPTGPPEQWPGWMRNQIEDADYVFVCPCEKYRKRFYGEAEPGKGRGVVFEGCIITNRLYRAEMKNEKFIYILFDDSDYQFVPDEIAGVTGYLIPGQQEALIQAILDFEKLKRDDKSTNSDVADASGGSGSAEPPTFEEWCQATATRFVDLLFSLRNDKRRHDVIDAIGLSPEAERETLRKSLYEFIRSHSVAATFQLETISLVIADLDRLRAEAVSAPGDGDILAELQDLLLPLCLSPAIKQQVAVHMSNHGAAIISEAVALEIGAELATATADGRPPKFKLNDAGEVAGKGLLKFVNQAIGDPSPHAIAAEILQDLADQLGRSVKHDMDDETDAAKRITALCKQLRLAFKVYEKRGQPRYYCIVNLTGDPVLRKKFIDVLRQIRRELPYLVFFELHASAGAAVREGEEIVMQILKHRFEN